MAEIIKYNFCELPEGQGDIHKLTENEYKKYKRPLQQKKLTWKEIGFEKHSTDKIKNYARYVPKGCVFVDIDDKMEALEFLKIVRLMKYRCLVLITFNGMQFLFRENCNPDSFCLYEKEITGIDNWLGMNTDAKGFGGVQNIRVYGNQRKEFMSWDSTFLAEGEFASDKVKDISDSETIDIDLLDEIPFWALPKPRERNLFKNGEHGDTKAGDDEVWIRGGKAFSGKNEKGEIVKLESYTPITVLKTMIPGSRHTYIFEHCAYFCVSNGFSLEDYKETLHVINKCYFRFNGGEMTDTELLTDTDEKWAENEEKLENWGYIWDEDKLCYWKKGKEYMKEKHKEISTIKSITAKELSIKILPELYVVVKGLLGQGLSILAGQRKLGKSWMILYLCYCICTGQPFLGFETIKSACFYLALEDNENRLQDRMNKVFGDKVFPDNLHFATKCEPIDNGLIEQLKNKLKEFPDIKLIVIDTLQKVRGVQGKNQNSYDYDYKEIGKLKEFADEHKICILVVHHLRKMKDNTDPFNNITGSTGITGAADTSIVLYKDDFRDINTHLVTQSRDFESIEKLLIFNEETFKWEVIGDYIDFEKKIEKLSYEANPIVITINKLLEDNPEGVKITSTDLLKKIIETTGIKPKDNPIALSKHIKGKLQFDLLAYGGIHYEPPPENGGSSGRNMFFCKIKKDT